jgi:hypothetical protein
MNTFVFILLLAISATICVANPLSGNACGDISPVTRWQRTARDDQIMMCIDTSVCRFQGTPMYFTSITGGVGHYLLTGINAVYEPTNNTFSIYVHSIDGASADTLMARSAQWSVNWFGLFP